MYERPIIAGGRVLMAYSNYVNDDTQEVDSFSQMLPGSLLPPFLSREPVLYYLRCGGGRFGGMAMGKGKKTRGENYSNHAVICLPSPY